MEEIELSIGTVKIKPLTNKIYNKALARANISIKRDGQVVNVVRNNLFFNYCERKMVKIPFWKWGSLTIKDGDKLREKILSMLKEDGVWHESKVADTPIEDDEADLNKEIHPKDMEWFQAQAARQKGMMHR